MRASFLSIGVAAIALVAHTTAQNSTNATLAQVLDADSRFSSLYDYLHQAGVFDSLNTYTGNLTLIAPTNTAWQTLLNSDLGSSLFAGPARVPRDYGYFAAVMQYHAVKGLGPYTVAQSVSGTFFETFLDNSTYELVPQGQWIRFVKNSANFTWYYADNQQSNVTADILTFANGVIYPVDTVMIPPYKLSTTLSNLGLTSLEGAIEAANLTTTLDELSVRPAVTVLAPLNAAFAAISASLNTLSSSQLYDILQYHVLPERQIVAPANGSTVDGGATFINGTVASTLLGGGFQKINVTVHADGTTFLNNARVISANIPIKNGLLHVIDQVLNPNEQDAAAPTASTGTVAYTAATSTSATADPFTTYVAAPTTTVPLVSAPAVTTGAAAALRTGGVGAIAAVVVAGAAAVLV